MLKDDGQRGLLKEKMQPSVLLCRHVKQERRGEQGNSFGEAGVGEVHLTHGKTTHCVCCLFPDSFDRSAGSIAKASEPQVGVATTLC